MTKRPLPLPYQINQCLHAVARLGQSRHQAKQRGVAQRYIYSSATYSRYRSAATCAVVAMAQRRPSITELRQITHADISRHIAICEDYGHARITIAVLLAALRKLEWGMRAKRWWSSPTFFVPPALKSTQPHSPRREPLDPTDVRRLLAHLDAETRLAVLFGFNYGLRIHEIVRLRRSDIRANNALHVVGKGGRQRLVTRMHDAAFLADLPPGAGDDHIFGTMTPGERSAWTRRIERHMAQALDDLAIPHRDGDNMHALRRTYAKLFICDALNRGAAEDVARQELTEQMGHDRLNETYRYCPQQT